MANFIDVLSEARRRAILGGQPLTSQEINGIGSGWFDSAAAMNNKNRALALSEKNAADQLAQEKYLTEQQIEAAKQAQSSQMYGNILNTGVTTLGMDWLKSNPGESIISKGAGLVKDVASPLINKGLDLVGMGAKTPMFTDALSTAKSLSDVTGTGQGVSLLPEAGGTIEPGIGGEVAAGGAELAADALASNTGEILDIGVGAGDIAGLAGDAISSVAPYVGLYGLAKAGSKIGDMVINNNPGLKGTALDVWNDSFSEPLAVEQYYGNYLASKGVGTESTNKAIANSLNPIGNLMGSINDSQWDGKGGALDNIGQLVLAGDPITAGLLSGAQSLGIMDGSVTGSTTGDTVAAILTGGLSELSWICTATSKKSYMTDEEKEQMDILKKYTEENHPGWWKSYFKHGPILIKAIEQQETNLKEFYDNMRTVLIEPVCQQEDIEKAFKIYLAITKMLFRTYMRDFAFMEEN